AEGFFDKGIEPEVLYEAINEAVKNPRAFWRKKKPPKHPLSNREVEVLMLLSKGQTRFEIAEKLDISKRTVDAFIQRIYNKLGVNTAVEATVKGIQLGIIRVL
ncbi:MAG: LuxR C-terminal-related transcriptional regulator, partial [Eubacterium sp.]